MHLSIRLGHINKEFSKITSNAIKAIEKRTVKYEYTDFEKLFFIRVWDH